MKIRKTSQRLEVLGIGHPVSHKQLKGMRVGDEVRANVDGHNVAVGKVTALYKEYDNDLGFDACDVKINMDELEKTPINVIAIMAEALKKSKKKKGHISLRVGGNEAIGIVKRFNDKKWLSSQTVKMYVKKVEE